MLFNLIYANPTSNLAQGQVVQSPIKLILD